MRPVSRRHLLVELFEQLLDGVCRLGRLGFRTIEELETLPVATVAAIVPAANPQRPSVLADGALWEAGAGQVSAQPYLQLSPLQVQIFTACDGRCSLDELVAQLKPAPTEEELKEAFLGLVRAGAVVPAMIPSPPPDPTGQFGYQ